MTFSQEEIDCFADRDFFRTKAQITVKVRHILEELHGNIQSEMEGRDLIVPQRFNPEAVQFVKGEHLEDFPYQYLDFPRHYTRTEKFAFRSLFWWGHHVVFALILEGPHVRQYKENLINHFSEIAGHSICLCLSASLWEWKHGAGYTMELTQDRKSQTAAVLANRSFVKLARFVPLSDPIVQSGVMAHAGHQAFRAMLPVILA
ncbi:MAG: hypothetical protein MRJ96_03765 [Nitrospirales bacterium]|nr:hypothetical protein [Nitrospira sp.]MDR4500556.1 hypothetical protein [Nitrospirales bacterium]